MNEWKRRELLQELMAMPVRKFRKSSIENPSEKTLWVCFTIEHPTYGKLEVKCLNNKSSETYLLAGGKRVAPACKLFRYLNGQWSGRMKRQLARRLTSFQGEGWQLHTAVGEHDESYLSRELDTDKIRVYESGVVKVHNVTVMTAPRLYRTLYQQVLSCDFEHCDDLT